MGIEWAEDSPAQRAQIQALYESLKGLRSFSERSTKAAAKYCTVGHKWCDAGDALAGELRSFTTIDSAVLGPALGKLGETMRQVHEHGRAHLAATEQMCGCSVMDASKVDEDVQRVKEAKKRFVACDDEWRAALKKAHSVRTNTHTGKVLVADRGFVSTKLAFELARLGLVGAINELEAGAQAALLDALARAAAAQLSYHEAAAERLRVAQAALGEAAASREATREAAAEERAAQTVTREHLLQLQRDHLGGKEDGAGGAAVAGSAAAAVVRPGGGAPASVGEGSSSATSATGRGPTQKEGFLFIKDRKKTSKALIHGSPTWRRVWFRLEQGKLLYRAKGKDGRGLSSLKAVGGNSEVDSLDEVPQEIVNLLICTVQVRSMLASYHPIAQEVANPLTYNHVQVRSGEHGKRWCFDVVSPYRSYTLQARHLVTTPPPSYDPAT